MFLPEMSFTRAHLYREELFLNSNRELTNVLVQGNPVFFDIIMPGATQPKVRICFPEVGTAWVYANGEISSINLVGESTKKDGLPLYTQVEYRFGMEMKAWLFFAYLPRELAESRYDEDNIVNYSILNSSSGHGGVLVRIVHGKDRTSIEREWMEIYAFDMGNDTEFHLKWRNHPNTKLIARFVPNGAGTSQLRWEPLCLEGSPRVTT